MVVDTFVPNDARICGGDWRPEFQDGEQAREGSPGWNNVVICTGANACGKVRRHEIGDTFDTDFDSQSVYLKQVRPRNLRLHVFA